MKHLLCLLSLIGFLAISISQAQVVTNYTLPSSLPYTFTQHSEPAPGYTFIGSYTFGSSAPYPSSIMIIDNDGAPAYYLDVPLNEGTLADLRVYPNGLMSYFAFLEDGLGNGIGQYYIMDSTFTIIDSVRCGNGFKTDGHELLLLPNGHYLTICLEERIMDLSGLTTEDGFPGDTDGVVLGPIIQELDTNKNVVFEWKGIDNYNLGDVIPYFFLDPDFLDFGHANALAIDLDGNILFSLRFFNEVTKISRQTGAIIWQLGGPQNNFTFVNDTQPFTAQHHCNVLPNGNLTLFDNGELANPTLARGVEYELDQTNLTATKVWEYANTPGIASYALGSMQRLPNDNNLICWGFSIPEFDNDIEEVDAAGNTVWELEWPELYCTYRAYKFEPIWDMDALRPTIACDTANGSTVLTASGGFDHYLWSTGDTTPSITTTLAGSYYVLGKSNNKNAYFGSKLKVIDNLTDPCDLISSIGSEMPLSDWALKVYPNPTTTTLTLVSTNTTVEHQLLLYNTLGVEVLRRLIANTTEQIDVTSLSPGNYTAVVLSSDGEIKKKLNVQIAR